jgi:hypothetical protein
LDQPDPPAFGAGRPGLIPEASTRSRASTPEDSPCLP